MSIRPSVGSSIVWTRRVLSVWWLTLALGWAAAAAAGPSDDLIHAASGGDPLAVRALLDKGADINAQTTNG